MFLWDSYSVTINQIVAEIDFNIGTFFFFLMKQDSESIALKKQTS